MNSVTDLQTGKKAILIVDDEADIRLFIRGLLEDEGYAIYDAETVDQAKSILQEKTVDAVILDIWLGESNNDGLIILDHIIKQMKRYIPTVMISGHASVDLAVKTIKKGAYDFIEKPFKSDRLILMVRRALEAATLRNENEILRQEGGKTKQEEPLEKEQASIVMTMDEANDDNYLAYNLKDARAKFEHTYIMNQLKKHNGSASAVARTIGMERTAFYRKLKSLGIKE